MAPEALRDSAAAKVSASPCGLTQGGASLTSHCFGRGIATPAPLARPSVSPGVPLLTPHLVPHPAGARH
eukprot:560649-Prorocentrum_minimum.AAC.1